ncbi:MAG: helix-turn-helix domain-containing GNAT family N-acetyltransferase [Acidimicrobiales bacterium]
MTTSVEALRHFNRSFTQRIGVLDDRFLGLDRPLGHSRLLWEISPHGAAVGELRERLGLDSAYVSRLLRALETDGLIDTSTDPSDGRRRLVRLTDAGRDEWNRLDERSDALAGELLAPLSEGQRRRLVDALATADRLLRAATVRLDVVDPSSDAAIDSMTAYFDELDRLFPEGFDPGDTLVVDAPKLRAPLGRFVVAFADGAAVACGGVQEIGPQVGEIKRMWVHPDWRGVGLGRRMLEALEELARALGQHTVRLDTNSVLTEAINMYETAGYH